MRVFVSSVVAGFEPYRSAARRAIETIDAVPVMCEDFGARPYSPERACLTDIESSDALVLILGQRYGYAPQPGMSVTRQEFLHAAGLGLPILAFVQEGVDMEPEQAAFRDEVGAYRSGLTRETFSTADGLKDAIVRNLLRLGRRSEAITQAAFAARLAAISEQGSLWRGSPHPAFAFAFLPQPSRDVDLIRLETQRDALFARLAAAGLVPMRDGYEPVDRPDHTGLRTRNLLLRQYQDGLVALEVDATVESPGHAFASHYVPPSNLRRLGRACFQLVAANGGWFRVGLKRMDMAQVAELPAHPSNSFSMPMRSSDEAGEDHLLVPATEDLYQRWLDSAIAKLQRTLSLGH